MAQFDFIESASEGYKFVWIHRASVLRLAAVPVILKVVGFVITYTLSLEDNFLRQGLLLVPSYIAEGYLIAFYVRWMLLNEYGNAVALSGNPEEDDANLKDRTRLISAGMIVYVLIKMLLSLSVGLALSAEQVSDANAAPPDSNIAFLFGALVLLGFALWAFRLIWIYIPLTLGIRINDYLYAIKGLGSSFYLLGAWVLCFIPIAFVFMLLLQIIQTMFGIEDLESAGFAIALLIGGIQSVADTLIAIVSSLAIARGLGEIFGLKKSA